jgi:predicted aminopeptidase
MVSRTSKVIFAIAALYLSACSPGYVLRAAYEQAKIMSKRQKIDSVIEDPSTPPLDRQKLILVKEARQYAQTIGLDPKNTFKKYAKLDTDVLSWILIGSKPDAFQLFTWWFPIVGTVPYKGFFERQDAEDYSKILLEKGYEVSIRGSSAFSTLGWFDDPILSSTLQNDEISIVNTVIHESVHTTFWAKNKVDFNESFANFIGTIGACEFFKARLEIDKNNNYLEKCEQQKALQFEFAGMMEKLYAALDKLYKSDISSGEKVAAREAIFDSYIKPLREKYPNMKALQKINNAEIMQFKLYVSGFSDFLSFYGRYNNDLPTAVRAIIKNKESLKDASDPYAALNKL